MSSFSATGAYKFAGLATVASGRPDQARASSVWSAPNAGAEVRRAARRPVRRSRRDVRASISWCVARGSSRFGGSRSIRPARPWPGRVAGQRIGCLADRPRPYYWPFRDAAAAARRLWDRVDIDGSVNPQDTREREAGFASVRVHGSDITDLVVRTARLWRRAGASSSKGSTGGPADCQRQHASIGWDGHPEAGAAAGAAGRTGPHVQARRPVRTADRSAVRVDAPVGGEGHPLQGSGRVRQGDGVHGGSDPTSWSSYLRASPRRSPAAWISMAPATTGIRPSRCCQSIPPAATNRSPVPSSPSLPLRTEPSACRRFAPDRT